MKNSLLTGIVFVVFLLSACGTSNGGGSSLFQEGIAVFINNNYTFYDTVTSATNSSNYSEIYLARDKSIDEVTAELQDFEQPEKIGERQEDKQVLVYDDQFVILTDDEEYEGSTLIEVANKEFVRDNYNPSFFQGMLLMSFLNNMFGSNDWDRNQQAKCQQNPNNCYGGFSRSGGGYKGYTTPPSVRGGSSSVRGGGPGAGK